MKRFFHTNKEYCLVVYELTGAWVKRVQYASDWSEYYFYYDECNCKAIEDNFDRIQKAVYELEGAFAKWNLEQRCLTLYV